MCVPRTTRESVAQAVDDEECHLVSEYQPGRLILGRDGFPSWTHGLRP